MSQSIKNPETETKHLVMSRDKSQSQSQICVAFVQPVALSCRRNALEGDVLYIRPSESLKNAPKTQMLHHLAAAFA